MFGCSVGSQVGTVLHLWKAEVEVEKALGFGHAWKHVKTRAIVIRIYLGFWEM